MKTILYDLFQSQPVGTSKFHGGGEYIKVIFKELIERKNNDCKIIVFYSKDKFLDDWILDLIKNNNIEEYYISQIDEVYSIFDIIDIDIFYSGLPYYYHKNKIPNNVIVRGTIHGLRFLELPSDKYAYLYSKGKTKCKEYVKYILQSPYRAKKRKDFLQCIRLIDELVCVSNHTKYAIKSFYPEVKEKDIYVYYTPQKKAEFCSDSRSIISGRYILVMGGDRWIKNCYREIIALDNLFIKGYLKDYSVVVVGGLTPSIKKKIKSLNRFKIMGYLKTEELENVYKFSDLFLYASLNEGFGMPPLEAMKYGVTCIVSGVCSLPEICGDAVYYVNPYDVEEMSGRILNAISEKIDSELVLNQFKKVFGKQKKDLEKICEFIMR